MKSHLHKTIFTCLALIIMITSRSTFATGGDPVAGKEKSKLCQGCHGEDGSSTGELVPKISGQYEKYIVKQLQEYRAGLRSNEIMNAMAVTLNDKDITDISSYFAHQVKMKGDGSTPNEKGKKIYLK